MGCTGACLLRQYGDGYRLLAERLSDDGPRVWDPDTLTFKELVGAPAIFRYYKGLYATDVLVTLATRLRPYESVVGSVDAALASGISAIAGAVEQRLGLEAAFGGAAASLWSLPRRGDPGSRPVVGVTGDLYTRVNEPGSAYLVRRLEEMGCEVWPHPGFAFIGDLSSIAETPRYALRGRLNAAFHEGLAWVLMAAARRQLEARLAPEVRELAAEPNPDAHFRYASPYLEEHTSYLIVQIVGKMVEFLRRGVAGVVAAAGVNCMVGVSAAATIPALRADHGDAPVLALTCGSTEAPAQRLRLETFVHQVHERHRRELDRERRRAPHVA